MTPAVFDRRSCELGEGALWHPERRELLWFDILGMRLMSRRRTWQFDECVSAAGWVSHDVLLVASETALFTFDLEKEQRRHIVDLESDVSTTRSNDGRADPYGGFWIGTMGKEAEDGAGAIYRYFRGEVRRLRANVSVPNAICFAPDGTTAYFADTHDGRILRQRLGPEGWPTGEPEVFLDAREEDWGPDGAVVDAEGCLWNAHWGGSRVVRYTAEGQQILTVDLPTPRVTCPAFGGPDLSTLFVTTAAIGERPPAGQTFSCEVGVSGQRENRVIL